MVKNDISVESVEVILLSEIQRSSAAMMRDAYLPRPGEEGKNGSERSGQDEGTCPEDTLAGPDARVFITKMVSRTPDDVIDQVRMQDPGRTTGTENMVFYTVLFAISMRPGDPSTTRLINGMIEFAFPEDTGIISYSPKDKSSITALIENGRDAFTISPALEFSSSANVKPPGTGQKNRFGIPAGNGNLLSGSYTKKTGYSFGIPAGSLLEYEGILKNRHEVFWEFYPPMPPYDSQNSDEEQLAVFSLIVGTSQKSLPKIRSIIDCKVKGNLWGVISLAGSVEIP
jgi:hypothetical protein